jgi:hypothetical protein
MLILIIVLILCLMALDITSLNMTSFIIFRFDSVYKAQSATMRLLTFNCFWYSTAILPKHDESAWFPDASFKNIYWYVSIS